MNDAKKFNIGEISNSICNEHAGHLVKKKYRVRILNSDKLNFVSVDWFKV